MKKMFKKEFKNITFVSTVLGLESIDYVLPRPAKHFIPEWFKQIHASRTDTVRVCPSFPDYFSLGYILPMWSDVVLRLDERGPFVGTSIKEFTWDDHGDNQFIDHVYANFQGVDAQHVFKPDCPWRIITPPGWSVLQLPLFYHFNKGFSVLPGVLDTDIHNEINQQLLYHGNGEDVLIKAGEPFVMYVPYKRDNKLKLETRYQTKDDEYLFKSRHLDLNLELRPNGAYKKRQRERDKKK